MDKVLVADARLVTKGQVIMVLVNHELDNEVAQAREEKKQVELISAGRWPTTGRST